MEQNICKKGVHFNLLNEDDKAILKFIKDNDINFSALTKQLILGHMGNVPEKTMKEMIDEALESKITGLAFQNEIRKVLMEMPQCGNILFNIKDGNELVDEPINMVDEAVSKFTDSDLAAMDF